MVQQRGELKGHLPAGACTFPTVVLMGVILTTAYPCRTLALTQVSAKEL